MEEISIPKIILTRMIGAMVAASTQLEQQNYFCEPYIKANLAFAIREAKECLKK